MARIVTVDRPWFSNISETQGCSTGLSLSSTPALVEDSWHEARRGWVSGPRHVCFRLLRWDHRYRYPRSTHHNHRGANDNSGTDHHRHINHNHRGANDDSGTDHHRRTHHNCDTDHPRRTHHNCDTNHHRSNLRYNLWSDHSPGDPRQCDCRLRLV